MPPTHPRRRWPRHGRWAALACLAWQGLVQPALGQASTPAPPDPASSAPQRVEINAAAPDSNAERRRSTASRIVYGREEIDRMGDSTVGEILKRLPGVTVSGRPGRGGAPRMRGLGNGYTQILIDGERMPRGFSLDSIEPDQIERIEILRAPTAETGARAIAGTINIVMREDFKRQQNDLRVSLGSEQTRPQLNAAWTYANTAGAMDYTVSASANRRQQADDTLLHTLGTDAKGTPTLEQWLHARGQGWRDGVFVSSRLRWREAGDSLELQPYLTTSEGHGSSLNTLQQTLGSGPAPYATSTTQSDSRTTLGRLQGSWLHRTDDGARLQLRFGASLAQSDATTRTHQEGGGDGRVLDRLDDTSQQDRSFNLSGKLSKLVADRHSLVGGWELQANQRNDRHVTLDNGVAQLAEFGDEVQARTLRLAGYVQDEWEASPQFGFNAGLRWEGISTRSDSALQSVRNLSSVVTPLLHMVWRFPERPRDQLRLSLTRSYRSPSTAQLIARPRLSGLYPAEGANQPTSPDRAGNPELKPELARGLDLALEHYLEAGGIVSANLFVCRIDNLIRTVRTLQDVSWSPVQRWVAAPRNIGGAFASGLELEAKFRAADLWATDWPLTVRSNLSLFKSRVDQVPGPNNRLDQQPSYTANIGFDLPVRPLPLTVGANLNFTPSYSVQQIDSQVYEQGVKRVIDAYALWRFSPQAQMRLSLSNLSPRDYQSATTIALDDGSAQTQDTLARTYLVVNLRLELKF